jgi:DNA-binding transcriptional LysR family regulator
MKLDLNLLPVALAIYETRSVSQAARRLGMSQPALSAALGRLRVAFNDQLFVRTSRGMEPTPRALALMTPTRDILARIEDDLLTGIEFDPALTTHKFSFALSDIGEMVFLPKLLERIRQEAPAASVSSHTMPPEQIASALESGEIDLAIGYFPDLKRGNFFQQRLFSHGFVCLISAGHPYHGERFTLDEFLSFGHAVIRAEGRSQEVFERLLTQRHIQRRVVLSTPHFMAIPFVIARSDLVVTVPLAVGESFAEFANIRLVAPPLEIPTFDLRQHWHRRYHKDARSKWLRHLVAELFTGDAAPQYAQHLGQPGV